MSEPFARRRFGQHFLADAGVIARIARALSPRAGEPVVEIGPGRAALTRALVAACGRLAAIEIDRDLAATLRASFDADELVVLEGDVLDVRIDEAVAALGFPRGTRAAVAGNLPYNVSKPVAMKLVAERDSVARAVLMFQREVARRLTAPPGSRDYGPLTVLAGRAFEIETLFDVPPGAFRPRPAVVSSVTLWTPRAPSDLTAAEETVLRDLLACAFGQRRKTLASNLRRTLPGGDGEAARLCALAGIDGTRRAETLTPAEFRALAAIWPRGPR